MHRPIPLFVGWLLSVLILFSACGSGGGNSSRVTEEDTDNNDAGLETAIAVSDPDELELLEATYINPDGSTGTREIPGNQIVLLFEVGVTHTQALDAIEAMGEELSAFELTQVGQIPDLGIYQLEIENLGVSAIEKLAVLDAVIDRLEAHKDVQNATYNELMRPRFAENDDDNCAIRGVDRSPFAIIDYYQAIPAIDAVRRDLEFAYVTVAVIDSGIDLDTGQFDDVQGGAAFEYILLGSPNARPRDIDSDRHGTSVAGIIAADNGDGVTNGIALRILEEKLSLIIGRVTTNWNMTRAIATAQESINRGARIVNMSFGDHADGRRPRWLRRLQDDFTRLFENNPDVLFVAAASNDGFELDNNDAPAGIPAANLITVGGISAENFDTIYPQSSTGPGIDIAAPAVNVPICCSSSNGLSYSDGNSMATPIVSAIAAVFLSLDLEMSGSEVKDFLMDPQNTYPAPEAVGGIRPALLRTLGNAILQKGLTVGAVDELMDAYPLEDEADPPAAIMSRLVSEYEFSVSGPGHHVDHVVSSGETNPADLTSGASNSIWSGGAGGFQLWLTYDADLVKIDALREFRLGDFSIGAMGSEIIATLYSRGSGGIYHGISSSGTLSFRECELTTRSVPIEGYDIRHDPIEASAAVEVRGVLEDLSLIGTFSDGTEDVPYDVAGSFTLLFGLNNIDADTALHLEENCIGGYFVP